ncbi:MAG TPA: EVE domain-containing protein [Terrimicrobiaceae bacterium]
MNYWLVKQEPSAYSWDDFVKDGRTAWTGVRNYQARNNLRAMRLGDRVFFYHSVKDKSVIGEAEVVREAYGDPTAEEGDWSSVDLKPIRPLPHPVQLAKIKAEKRLAGMALLRHSRLSVTPVSAQEYRAIAELSKG